MVIQFCYLYLLSIRQNNVTTSLFDVALKLPYSCSRNVGRRLWDVATTSFLQRRPTCPSQLYDDVRATLDSDVATTLWRCLCVYWARVKKKSKVQEKNISREPALNLDKWKTFSKNYKPMRVWLWFHYKFTVNNYRLRLFSEFIQTIKGILPLLTKQAYQAKIFYIN